MRPSDTGGLTGFVIDVISTLGEVGVALLVLAENVVPPIPSEVVLPFAGALAAEGRFTWLGVVVAATIGSVLGAVLLYELGARLGTERVARGLARIPLVEEDDFDRGQEWFERHGYGAVLFGRLVPGVRSLVSVPAGTAHMDRVPFLALTAAGSAVWNGLLVWGGLALGNNWDRVEQYTAWLDVAMYAAVAFVVLRLLWRRFGPSDS